MASTSFNNQLMLLKVHKSVVLMIKCVQKGDCNIYHIHSTDSVEMRPWQLSLRAMLRYLLTVRKI